MLFLSPFIAETTLLAYGCHSLQFRTRGPLSFVCVGPLEPVSIMRIYDKIKWETFFWGAGTAIGELPPYFVARTAALAGQNNYELSDIQDILAKHPSQRLLVEKAQVFMHRLVTKVGFLGILLCASIPNPFFDLAGIICGHFLVPFSTFFGATFIGKSLVKCTVQALSVIILFSEDVRPIMLSRLKSFAPFLHNIVAELMHGHEFDTVADENRNTRLNVNPFFFFSDFCT